MTNEQELHWYPLRQFGFTDPFYTLNGGTLIHTWIALTLLCGAVIAARYFLRSAMLSAREQEPSTEAPEFTVVTYGAYTVKLIIKGLMSLVEQSTGTFIYRYYSFIGALFGYILFCNWLAIFPYAEEPTKDINTTLALGIIVLFYIQKEAIRVHGAVRYLKDFFLPVEIFFPLNILIGLPMFFLKLLGELAMAMSLSFRLFGNIFGGAIIMKLFQQAVSNSILLQSFATLIGLPLLLTGFFVLFVGGLQAFVFSILTLTNLTLATTIEQDKHS